MHTEKIRSLRTIAELRKLADELATYAAGAALRLAAEAPTMKGALAAIQEEAETYTTVANELTELADEFERYRCYNIGRYHIGPLSGLSPEEALKVVEAVKAAPATLECSGTVPGTGEAITVRLVPFYDAHLDEDRWATECTNTSGLIALTDHADRADAEYRYWDIIKSVGLVKPE
jgi:hypothetical protein